jgi:hypothetical protein
MREEATGWIDLGGTAGIDTMPVASARLALDRADGVTPYVVYQPLDDSKTIVPVRFDGVTWSEQPALSRGLERAFDFAVVGGQMFIAYDDGISGDDTRLYLAQGSSSGWAPAMRLDGDVDLPVVGTHILTLGPSATDVVVAWEAVGATPESHQVFIKQNLASGWERLPDAYPLSPENMVGFAIAADPTRIGLVWSTLDRSAPVVRYFEFGR